MEFRYYIGKKWTKAEIMEAIEAFEFTAKFYSLEGVTSVRLYSDMSTKEEGTAEQKKKNRFEVRINKHDLIEMDDLVRAIIHEMTHIKQFVEDGLDFETKEFLGSTYEDTPYWYTPWEMEARAMEEPLLLDFREVH